MGSRLGVKVDWIGGWIGAFLWVLIMAIVWLVQSKTPEGLAGLAVVSLAAVIIFSDSAMETPEDTLLEADVAGLRSARLVGGLGRLVVRGERVRVGLVVRSLGTAASDSVWHDRTPPLELLRSTADACGQPRQGRRVSSSTDRPGQATQRYNFFISHAMFCPRTCMV